MLSASEISPSSIFPGRGPSKVPAPSNAVKCEYKGQYSLAPYRVDRGPRGRSSSSREIGATLNDEAVRAQEVEPATAKVPSIRSRVREPTITLSIKLP
jgi:hypothetical protein